MTEDVSTVTKPARIALVTTGLMAAGALFGAIAGAIALTVSLAMFRMESLLVVAYLGALFGAPIGAIAAPILAWLLLRRVPLGRMFAGCAAGTIVGGVIGFMLTPVVDNLFVPGLFGALLGCLVVAIYLRFSPRRARQV